MRYLIDTNVCIYVMNRHPEEVIQKFKLTAIGDVGISSITLAELQYGVAKSRYREKNQKRLYEFLTPLEVLAFNEKATKCYGEIRYLLEQKGLLIGPLDLLIAAHAFSLGLTLVTNNEKEFGRIRNLKTVNWVR